MAGAGVCKLWKTMPANARIRRENLALAAGASAGIVAV
jgi:hypothetical protein